MSVLLERRRATGTGTEAGARMAPAAGFNRCSTWALVGGIRLLWRARRILSSQFVGQSRDGRRHPGVWSSSALPLPSNQPVNQNVLATETPSQAPAPPAPKAKQAEDETAIPISGKQKKPEKETAPKRPRKAATGARTNRANYGEQAGSSIRVRHSSRALRAARPP